MTKPLTGSMRFMTGKDEERFDEQDNGYFVFCSVRDGACGLTTTCDRIHRKGRDGDKLLDLSYGKQLDGSCKYWLPREALTRDKDIFRGKGRRHNAHAPPSRIQQGLFKK